MATRKKTASRAKTAKKKSASKKAKKTKKTTRKRGKAGKTTARKSTKSKAKETKKTAKKSARKTATVPKPAAVKPAPPQKPAKVTPKKRKMPVKERREFRAMLMGLKERLVEQIAALRNDSLTRHEPINPEEDGTVAFDRQFALNLVSTERESLFEIDDALRRIEEHTYGVCEECGELIGESRLRALPFVRMCVGCQSAKEKGKVKFTPMFG